MQTTKQQDAHIAIKLEVDRVTFRNDENGWTVLKGSLLDTGYPVTLVGFCTPLKVGQQIQAIGDWTEHKQFGKQFTLERFTNLRPDSRDGILKYLSSGVINGIGPKTASKIIDHFGEDTLKILDDDPERLREIPSIGKKKSESIIVDWQDNKIVNEVMMFLTSHGISPLFANRIYKLYGRSSIDIVSTDPYRLSIDVAGIGFIKADSIASQIGIAPDSPERIKAAIIHVLQSGEDQGHCYQTYEQLTAELQRLLQLGPKQLEDKLTDCMGILESASSIIVEVENGTKAIYRRDLWLSEVDVSQRLETLAQTSLTIDSDRVERWLDRYSEAATAPLSDDQLDAVRQAAKSRIFILTGGPGVGKTTTANAIIRLIMAMGRNVALCAPTGRAAQRLGEVADLSAKTIHRMLEWLPREGGFGRDEDNPLSVQAVVCDESSMLDIKLADALLRAVPDTAQIILIGDVDQLPSVGPGNFLHDLIKSEKVPYKRLHQIFRQAATSNIVQAAHQINTGKYPEISNAAASDCRFLERDSPESIIETIKDLIVKELPKSMDIDMVRDIQVLTPMNRGPLGTQSLNATLQELLNPKVKGMREYKRQNYFLRPGDKVIQSSNNYDLNVFNGDIGFVQDTGVDGDKLMVSFGERSVSYDNEAAADLRLAYAITIHKAQGSEFPVVLLPVSTQHYVMLQRNLIYTGLTRAKKFACFIGSNKALGMAVENQRARARQTMLVERLQNHKIPQ